MRKLIISGLRASKGRLAMTVLAVVFGVSFVAGSFILADSLRSIFNQISEDAFAGVDAQVQRTANELETSDGLARFDGGLVDDINALPEVELAEGGIFAIEQAYTVDADGEVVRPAGPPVFLSSWGGPSVVSAFSLLEGEAPVGQQIALDQAQADALGASIGDDVTMALPSGDLTPFELTGIIDFGDGGTAGAYFIIMDLPTVQDTLGVGTEIDSIVINAVDGVETAELLSAVEAELPDDLEVLSGADVIAAQQDDFGEFIDIFGNVLLGFALVTLFVSTFIIYNTFAILVSQRARELGLLRALGASASQIRTLVLAEAAIVGAIACVLGLLGGMGVAAGLKRLFSIGAGEFPDGPLQIQPRTIIVVFVVGMLVTMASAAIPSVKASRVSPLEALRDGGETTRSLRFRLISGFAVLVPGIIMLAAGLLGASDSTSGVLTLLGLGSALTFIGVAMVSALFAGPVASAIGKPIDATMGVVGRVARQNASRNPQRTTATATALMIGLALITGVAVLTESLRTSFIAVLDNTVAADLFIFEENQGIPFSPLLVDQLAELPEVETAYGQVGLDTRIDGEVTWTQAVDSAGLDAIANIDVSEGDSNIGVDGIGVFGEKAEELGLGLGDTVTIELEDGFTTDLTVKAIYNESSLIDGANWMIDRSLTTGHLTDENIASAAVAFAPDVDTEVARAAVDEVLTGYPQLISQNSGEFKETLEGQINSLLAVIGGLLFLCVIVAFFGIVNTMALAVMERTREIGLLRAVGMTRRQLKRSVRWESVIVALYGSLLGVGMGLLLGWAAVSAVPDSFLSATAVPWGLILIFLAVGAVLGVLAAYFPARRAAKMQVLDAIAT